MGEIDIQELLKKAEANTHRSSKNYYKPLSKEESEAIREYFASKIEIPLDGDKESKFYNTAGTLIAEGYERVVVGDYGAFVEFSDEHIVKANVKQRWPGSTEKKFIRYVWMETNDDEKTKVYWQKQTVPYADYRVGRYYVHPAHLLVKDGE